MQNALRKRAEKQMVETKERKRPGIYIPLPLPNSERQQAAPFSKNVYSVTPIEEGLPNIQNGCIGKKLVDNKKQTE